MSTSPQPLSITTWRQAERNAIRWLRDLGYADAAAAPEGSPPGVDITSRWAIAQVRFGDSAVRRSELQQLTEARGDDEEVAIYAFTSSKFEIPALTYADVKGIALFSYDGSGAMLPRNAAASSVVGAPAATPTLWNGRVRATTSSPRFLKWLPLLVAIWLAFVVAFQAFLLSRGDGGSVAGLVFAAVGSLVFASWWFFGTRRSGRKP